MNRSFGYYCLQFAWLTLLVTAALIAISQALYTFAPDLANSLFSGGGGTGAGVVAVILPAMLVGQMFYKHEQRVMGRGEGWSMALVFTVLSIAVSGAIFMVLLQFFQPEEAAVAEMTAIWNNDRQVLLTIAGVFAVMLIPLNRLMLWSGVRGALKNEEKLAARAAKKAARKG